MNLAGKILEDREKRYNYIIELLQQYKLPVLCAKLNYPGEDKNTVEAKFAFEQMTSQVIDIFSGKILYSETSEGFDGKSFLAVLDMDGTAAKMSGIETEENHNIGRIFDIDVYGLDGVPLSRSDLKKECRKCVVCGKPARYCMREHAHSTDEVIHAVNLYINKQRMSGYE